MGYEIHYSYHPRKEGGGYDTDLKEEKSVKVGKPFDDTSLEKCAAAIMAQLSRRDVWVVDVKVFELVKNEISFKESADGKGVILKNKKYALGSTAEVLAEDLVEEKPIQVQPPIPSNALVLPPGMHPHELIQQQQPSQDLSGLYDANKPVPIKRQPRAPVNQNKVMYYVFFEPYMHQAEARNMKLKFTEDRKYPVHAVIPSPSGRLDAQQIAVTDDSGKVVTLDEKFFTSVGRGLLADEQLGFSGSNGRGEAKSKLMYADELVIGEHPAERNPQAAKPYKQIRRPSQADIPAGIPIDDGSIPEEMFAVPDLRPGKKF